MTRAALAAPELVLVRCGEIALKKKNRGVFERALVRNLREAVEGLSPVEIERTWGRITLRPERRGEAVARRAADVFGVKTVSPAWGSPNDVEEMARVGRALFEDALVERGGDLPVTFRIRVKRSNKAFPMVSTELERNLAERILSDPRQVRVRLDDAELTLGVEVRDRRSYLFLQSLPGPGGLPVGTLGRALCLISGGIDSPVAAWMAMKRGCRMGYVTFHSTPWIGAGFVRKVTELVRALGRWQGRAKLFVVPFADVQTAIRDTAPEAYRTVLYRRAMQRIGSALAERHGYGALVTGDSLGQVASQTLENMVCITDASRTLVLRPLLAMDKEEVIAVARRIGTFDLSNVPEPDCCTVFQPARPVLQGRVSDCVQAEQGFDVTGLVAAAVAGTEVRRVDYE